MQYEYTAIVVKPSGKIVEELNNFGAEGWELVYMETDNRYENLVEGDATSYKVFFKREKGTTK